MAGRFDDYGNCLDHKRYACSRCAQLDRDDDRARELAAEELEAARARRRGEHLVRFERVEDVDTLEARNPRRARLVDTWIDPARLEVVTEGPKVILSNHELLATSYVRTVSGKSLQLRGTPDHVRAVARGEAAP